MIKSAAGLFRKNSEFSWTMADQLMVSGSNFLTGILLARFLGVEMYGQYMLVWMVILFIGSIQHAVINSPMMSIGPKESNETIQTFYSNMLIQQVIFSLVTLFLLFFGIRFAGLFIPAIETQGLILPLTLAAFTFQFQDFLRRYFFTRSHEKKAFAIDAIRHIGQFTILIYLFLFSTVAMDHIKVLWIITITATLASIYGMFFYERIEIHSTALKKSIYRNWRFSKWLSASAFMQWTTAHCFTFTLGGLLGPAAVGGLKAAQNIIAVSHVLFHALENIIPSKASSKLHHYGKKSMNEYLGKVTIYGLLVMIAVGLTIGLVPEFWLNLFYGSSYKEYGLILQLWIISYIVGFPTHPLRAGIRAIEDTKLIFWSYVWMTLVSVISAYPLIINFGIVGAVGGIVLINCVQVFTLLVAYKGMMADPEVVSVKG